MMGVKIFSFLILAAFCGTALACSCLPMTDTQKYCKSDFVMKVRVLRNLKIRGYEGFYKIRIQNLPLKFRKEDKVVKKNRLYTARDSAACGVSLKRGKKYLISGFVDTDSGKMRINSCGSLVLAKSFYNFYKNNPPRCIILDLPIRTNQ